MMSVELYQEVARGARWPAACMPVQVAPHAEPAAAHLQVERTVSMRRAVGPGRQVEQHHL